MMALKARGETRNSHLRVAGKSSRETVVVRVLPQMELDIPRSSVSE
jgi:hypothetical protein